MFLNDKDEQNHASHLYFINQNFCVILGSTTNIHFKLFQFWAHLLQVNGNLTNI